MLGPYVSTQAGPPHTKIPSTPNGFGYGDTPIFEYPYSISGQATDPNGAPMSGVTVKLYRTADDSYVHQTVSDANGNYVIPASQVLQHYLVAYMVMIPDNCGTTANTLVGT